MVAEVPKRRARPAHTPPIMRPWVGRTRADMCGSFVSVGARRLPCGCLICLPRYGDEGGKASLYGAIPTLGNVGVRP
ncbi:hypothetical protein GCM10022403_057190 [Streptomyces coacervatus]|uniref:Uncharacterized protein n=1 Tax=Streptomyces coacervatus TaxID=647381 RepID=A0ABP7IEF8_9ACTN